MEAMGPHRLPFRSFGHLSLFSENSMKCFAKSGMRSARLGKLDCPRLLYPESTPNS